MILIGLHEIELQSFLGIIFTHFVARSLTLAQLKASQHGEEEEGERVTHYTHTCKRI